MHQKFIFFHIAVFIFFVCFSGTPPAYAQSDASFAAPSMDPLLSERSSILRQLNYDLRILRAKDYVEGRVIARYPFHELLHVYAQMENYDPIGHKTVDKLYELAFLANNSEDSDMAIAATEEFRDLLHNHLPNLEVLNVAIPLVRQNSFLGDIALLEWMRDGLEARVLNSGPGTVAFNAYRIYTLAEEFAVLRHRNVKVIDTDSISTPREHYHIYMVQDLNTGAPDMIYMQLTPIMQHLRARERIERPQFAFELRPQPALTD